MFRFLMLTALITTCGILAGAQTPTIGGCSIFPSNNVWNTPINNLPVSGNSAAYVQTIGSSSPVHPDFGSDASNGIPYTIVSGSPNPISINFAYASESDAGPYPMPANPLIEGGSDRHILLIDTANCTDYELFEASQNSDGSWSASSGAIFSLNSNALRPDGWTSADAAGLPVLPGLVTYDEAASGVIRHAIRFTAPQTNSIYIWPARHAASYLSGSQYPPMGTRFRLKASFDISTFPAVAQVILTAMKTYGIILADNGAPWFISGAPDSRWSDDDLHSLTFVNGSDLEAVDESSLMVNANSAQAGASASTPAPTTPAPTTPAPTTPAIPTNTWVEIVSQNSGKCIQSMGSGDYQPLAQWACNGAANQAFLLNPVAGGYEITSQSSGMQFDVRGGPSATGNGVPLQQYTYWGGSNEVFKIVPAQTSGYYQIEPVNSGSCLDVTGISIYDSAPIQQWACWGGANQSWKFVATQ